jgi:hypothetical protein
LCFSPTNLIFSSEPCDGNQRSEGKYITSEAGKGGVWQEHDRQTVRCLTMGESCIIAGRPVNIGACTLQESAAKMKGKLASGTSVAGVGHVAKLYRGSSGIFLLTIPTRRFSLTECRRSTD